MTFEEYKAYYFKYKRFPSGQYSSPKQLNEAQLTTKYKAYRKSIEKAMVKKSLTVQKPFSSKPKTERSKNIERAMQESRENDINAELFWSRITGEQAEVVRKEMKKIPQFSLIVGGHLFGKGAYPQLADDSENIIQIPQAFHFYIDQYKNPFSEQHESISREQHENIWRQIVGDELYDKLLERARI